jgi:hypothetical protein
MQFRLLTLHSAVVLSEQHFRFAVLGRTIYFLKDHKINFVKGNMWFLSKLGIHVTVVVPVILRLARV